MSRHNPAHLPNGMAAKRRKRGFPFMRFLRFFATIILVHASFHHPASLAIH
jgi:hypothetical protein